VLAARDARQAILDRAAGAGVLVVVSTNVPGARKDRPGASELVARMGARVAEAFAGAAIERMSADALGPWLVARVAGDAREVKRIAVAIEEGDAAGRIADLDVVDRDGRLVGRAAIGLGPRRCLLCDEPAVDCMRIGRHAPAALIERVDALLTDRRR
jgi:holo-ACP synthase CitX